MNQNDTHDDMMDTDIPASDTAEAAPIADQDETTTLVESLQNDVASWKDKAMRLAAEMENLRKRAQRDQEDALKYGLSSAAKQFLSVADNLERALSSVAKTRDMMPDPVINLLNGIDATQKDLMAALSKIGVNPIEVKIGDALDPQIHEVMFDSPSNDYPPGVVLHILETGYKIHDRLLRPSRVAVTKAAPGGDAKTMDIEA